tara:strand:+ start:621 stop:890 length:270 start_codon:yes stop_codon:yes gene_type:complete
MDSYGEARMTSKFGYFQNRGGYCRYLNGHDGRGYTKGKTPHDIREKSAIETKAKLVPDDKHVTTAKAPVDKKEVVHDDHDPNDQQVAEG